MYCPVLTSAGRSKKRYANLALRFITSSAATLHLDDLHDLAGTQLVVIVHRVDELPDLLLRDLAQGSEACEHVKTTSVLLERVAELDLERCEVRLLLRHLRPPAVTVVRPRPSDRDVVSGTWDATACHPRLRRMRPLPRRCGLATPTEIVRSCRSRCLRHRPGGECRDGRACRARGNPSSPASDPSCPPFRPCSRSPPRCTS